MKTKQFIMSPIDGVDITKGKEYEVLREAGETAIIKDDEGFPLVCRLAGSTHINGEKWKLINR